MICSDELFRTIGGYGSNDDNISSILNMLLRGRGLRLEGDKC